MKVYITQSISIDITGKFSFVAGYDSSLENFFDEREYGKDLEILYISLFCMAPEFETFFTPVKPKYILKGKDRIHKGVMLEAEDKCLKYELRLNHSVYRNSADIKPLLAEDILSSLDIIGTINKIKDFELDKFREDFKSYFQQNGWI